MKMGRFIGIIHDINGLANFDLFLVIDPVFIFQSVDLPISFKFDNWNIVSGRASSACCIYFLN